MRSRCKSCLLFIPGCVLLLLLAGCGRDGRLPVTGEVKLDGQPLAAGAISFSPQGDTTGPTSGATVRNGSFHIGSAHGLLPGEYQVQLMVFRETGRLLEDPQFGQVVEQQPVAIREADQLTARIANDGENHLSFDVTSLSPGEGL